MKAEINEVADDAGISSIKYSFNTIDIIEKLDPNSITDLCGAIILVEELYEFVSKKGENLKKRVVHATDMSNCGIEITL